MIAFDVKREPAAKVKRAGKPRKRGREGDPTPVFRGDLGRRKMRKQISVKEASGRR